MKVKNIIYILSLSTIYISCLKEEIPIEPQIRTANVSQVNMGSDYGLQIYFNLENNSIVKQNIKTDWDIAFESSIDGWHIILNSSVASSVANTENTNFNSVIDTTGTNWKWDVPNGNLDSTAIGDYRNNNEVYIINRGYDINGNLIGFKKITFDNISGNEYEIHYADLDGNNENSIIIPKDSSVNFIGFSFTTNSIVDIEPNKENWDLLFTQYTHIFQNPLMPYLVTGVIINRNNTSISSDNVNVYDEINSSNIDSYVFNNEIDFIGYDWKTYDFNSGNYVVDQNSNYIIKTNVGFYYKLHFIDFYDDAGLKGSPKFEYQKL